MLKVSEVKTVNVPHFDEISVKNIFPRFKDDARVMQFMPSSVGPGKLPDRSFFFNILNTVHPEFVDGAIKHANKQRYESGQAEN